MSESSLVAAAEAARVAAEARTRLRRVALQRQTTGALVAARRQELAELQHTLDAEDSDVLRLEQLSPTKIWATLRGNASERLAVERAQAEAAAFAVAGAQARLTSAVADDERVRRDHEALLGAEDDYDAALAAYESALHATGGHVAAELKDLSEESGTAEAHLREVEEAMNATETTSAALDTALAKLNSAGGWSTYDTFFGGGLIADAIKHSRIDEATRAFAEVNRALETLTVELADIGVSSLDGVSISDTLAVFDVFFDNIISDWMVRDRIAQARTDAAVLRDRLDRLEVELGDDARRTSTRLTSLLRRREEILTG